VTPTATGTDTDVPTKSPSRTGKTNRAAAKLAVEPMVSRRPSEKIP
jgi:hypothetical protein